MTNHRIYSSADYTTAARVLDGIGGAVELIDDLTGLAAEAKRAETYIVSLAKLVDPRVDLSSSGYGIFLQLVADGWTPPEGFI